MIEQFAEHLAVKGLSERSMKSYLRYYRHFDNGLKDQDLNQSYINSFLLKYSCNTSRAFLKHLFEFLKITDLKIPKLTGRKPQQKRRSLTKQDVKVLRQWLYTNKGFRYLILFDLNYYCALRRGEVMAIKIKDFYLKEWAEDPTKSCKLLIHGKGNKERFVPVYPKIMHNVIKYVQDQKKVAEDRLFAFNYTIWHTAFKDAVKNTMDYNFTLHDLRRSRATQWINDGIDISRVKTRLGHSDISTTQVYVNLDEKKEFDKWAEE